MVDVDANEASSSLVFIDGTLGGGGHSEALLQQLQPGDIVIGCDVDPRAIQTASERLKKYMIIAGDNDDAKSSRRPVNFFFLFGGRCHFGFLFEYSSFGL